MLLGFAFGASDDDVGPVRGGDAQRHRDVARHEGHDVAHRPASSTPEARKQISGVVGSYETTRQTFKFDVAQALVILALISLSLAIVNLFPFLPLDGGHIFWALAEKVRGKPIPFSVMERASVVGFVLVLVLFFIGLTNDIGRLRGRASGSAELSSITGSLPVAAAGVCVETVGRRELRSPIVRERAAPASRGRSAAPRALVPTSLLASRRRRRT